MLAEESLALTQVFRCNPTNAETVNQRRDCESQSTRSNLSAITGREGWFTPGCLTKTRMGWTFSVPWLQVNPGQRG